MEDAARAIAAPDTPDTIAADPAPAPARPREDDSDADDRLPAAEQIGGSLEHRSGNHIIQLANIAGPIVAHEQV